MAASAGKVAVAVVVESRRRLAGCYCRVLLCATAETAAVMSAVCRRAAAVDLTRRRAVDLTRRRATCPAAGLFRVLSKYVIGYGWQGMQTGQEDAWAQVRAPRCTRRSDSTARVSPLESVKELASRPGPGKLARAPTCQRQPPPPDELHRPNQRQASPDICGVAHGSPVRKRALQTHARPMPPLRWMHLRFVTNPRLRSSF